MADEQLPIKDMPGGERTTIDPTDAFIIEPLVGATSWIAAQTILDDFNDSVKQACKVTASAPQSIANNVTVALNWNQETFDFGGFHDNVTNNSRLTIPTGEGGIYRVAGQSSFAGNATGIRDGKLIVNGATIVGFYRLGNPVAGSENIVVGETIVDLAEGDYVEFAVLQNSGGNLNANQTAIMNEFFIHLLART